MCAGVLIPTRWFTVPLTSVGAPAERTWTDRSIVIRSDPCVSLCPMCSYIMLVAVLGLWESSQALPTSVCYRRAKPPNRTGAAAHRTPPTLLYCALLTQRRARVRRRSCTNCHVACAVPGTQHQHAATLELGSWEYMCDRRPPNAHSRPCTTTTGGRTRGTRRWRTAAHMLSTSPPVRSTRTQATPCAILQAMPYQVPTTHATNERNRQIGRE